MLTEHIKNVLNGQPVYELEIPYVEGAMQDLLFPPADGDIVAEDFDRVPADLVGRITNLIKERQKVLAQEMVWFTFSVEDGECYSSWPVSAYRFGASNLACYNEPKVAQALRRLMKRGAIQSIRVTGPIPQHWYFGTIEHSE